MTPEQESWAEALAAERIHGACAVSFVIGRIDTLTLAEDSAGTMRWKAIGAKLDALLDAKGSQSSG